MNETRAESIWLREICNDKSTHSKINYRDSLPKETNIVIIGGGFSGLSVAYHLSLVHGTGCLVLEARQLCGSATGRNAGMIWPNQREIYEVKTTEKVFDYVNQQINKNGSFLTEDDVLVNASVGLRLVQRGSGASETDTPTSDIQSYLPGFDSSIEYTIYKEPSASFFPARVARAMAASSERAEFMEGIQVLGLERTADLQLIKTSKGNVYARQVVVCTNALIPELLPEFSSIVKPVTNSVLASKPIDEKLLPKVCGISEGNGSSEVYMNVRKDGRLILGGLRCIVEEEETSLWEKGIQVSDLGEGDPRIVSSLKDWLASHFPRIFSVVEWEYSWKGLIAINVRDNMPLVGRVPSGNGMDREGVYVCGVMGGHGMPRCLGLGAAVARMLLGEIESEDYCEEYIQRCRADRFA